MFKKRQKKEYPPGTFIPTPARICAIIQLCLAFTIILWNFSQPFMGELFAIKSQLLLYQDVMGITTKSVENLERQSRLERNRERFEALALDQKEAILDNYETLRRMTDRTFWVKLKRSLTVLAFDIPIYEKIWLVLSFLLPVMLLKRVDGARNAIWLLPLLAAVYASDNYLYSPLRSPPNAELFPSEEVIISQYVEEPRSSNIFKQSDQLLKGWKLYLIKEWAMVDPSNDPAEFVIQAEAGEFLFNMHRLKVYGSPEGLLSSRESHKEPMTLLLAYFLWNLFFAFTAWVCEGKNRLYERTT